MPRQIWIPSWSSMVALENLFSVLCCFWRWPSRFDPLNEIWISMGWLFHNSKSEHFTVTVEYISWFNLRLLKSWIFGLWPLAFLFQNLAQFDRRQSAPQKAMETVNFAELAMVSWIYVTSGWLVSGSDWIFLCPFRVTFGWKKKILMWSSVPYRDVIFFLNPRCQMEERSLPLGTWHVRHGCCAEGGKHWKLFGESLTLSQRCCLNFSLFHHFLIAKKMPRLGCPQLDATCFHSCFQLIVHPGLMSQIASWLPPVRLVTLRRCNLCCGRSVAVLLELPGREIFRKNPPTTTVVFGTNRNKHV